MTVLNVLVVDDEPLARQRLQRMVTALEGYQVVGEAENGREAVERCRMLRPDVVLLDIRMPGVDGLAAAAEIAAMPQPPAIIFCTAYDDYALQAFDVHAVGYLLKPVKAADLQASLARARQLNRLQLQAINGLAPLAGPTLKATGHRGVAVIPLAEVRYLLAEQKYVTVFYCRDGACQQSLIDHSLKELEEAYPQQLFRVHRNALIAVAHLRGIEPVGEGHRVSLEGIAEGPAVSRRHLAALRQLLASI